jgi:hypothetical protein
MGPVIAQTTMTPIASRKVKGWPAATEMPVATRVKNRSIADP